jgi:hypothetical protein
MVVRVSMNEAQRRLRGFSTLTYPSCLLGALGMLKASVRGE